MNEWINIIISLSVAGSGVFVFAWLITYVFKRKINAKWHYRKRKLALFLFLMPIFVVVSIILNVFQRENNLISLEGLSAVQQSPNWLTTTFVQVIFTIWIIGVIVTGLRFFNWYRRFNKKLKTNLLPVPKEDTLHHLLNKNRKEMKLSKNVHITFCQVSISPVLIGVFKPTIVLPMYDIPYEELDMIIKHELTHYKKKDLWIKKVMLLATILHWYNPFIYFLRKEFESSTCGSFFKSLILFSFTSLNVSDYINISTLRISSFSLF